MRAFSPEVFFRWRCSWEYSGGVATDLFVHMLRRGGAGTLVWDRDKVIVTGEREDKDLSCIAASRGMRWDFAAHKVTTS
jgi:hypothetical protein